MDQKYTSALAVSIGLHLALAFVLFFGDFTNEHKATPTPTAQKMEPIQAVAVDRSKVEAHVKRLKKEKDDAKAKEKKRIKDLEERAASAKRKRAKEQQRIKDLEKQRKKKELEKRKADDAAKASKAKADAAEKQRKKKELEKQTAEKAAADAKARRLKEEAATKKAEELRKKQAAERKRKEQEAKERALEEQMLAEQMQAEMAERQKARSKQVMSEIDRFTALITQTIQRNLLTDRDTMEGKSCKLTISLAPSGFVTNVVPGVGDRTVCAAAKNAIYKAGTLPVSKDPQVFKEMSTISLTVVPEF